jgi:hypothetical protein
LVLGDKFGKEGEMGRMIPITIFFSLVIASAAYEAYEILSRPTPPPMTVEREREIQAMLLAEAGAETRRVMMAPPTCWEYRGPSRTPEWMKLDPKERPKEAVKQWSDKRSEILQRWIGVGPELAYTACEEYNNVK